MRVTVVASITGWGIGGLAVGFLLLVERGDPTASASIALTLEARLVEIIMAVTTLETGLIVEPMLKGRVQQHLTLLPHCSQLIRST